MPTDHPQTPTTANNKEPATYHPPAPTTNNQPQQQRPSSDNQPPTADYNHPPTRVTNDHPTTTTTDTNHNNKTPPEKNSSNITTSTNGLRQAQRPDRDNAARTCPGLLRHRFGRVVETSRALLLINIAPWPYGGTPVAIPSGPYYMLRWLLSFEWDYAGDAQNARRDPTDGHPPTTTPNASQNTTPLPPTTLAPLFLPATTATPTPATTATMVGPLAGCCA